MMKTSVTLMMFAALISTAALAGGCDIPVTGPEAPTSLADIVGTPTMITVVLKDSGARDPNLKLLEVRQDRIMVIAPNCDIIPYMVDSVEKLEVQGGTVEQKRSSRLDTQMLRPEHQRVVERAWMRVREIYAASADNQALKIQAATLLSMDNDAEAHNYLRQLAESNDIETQLTASGALFLVGDAVSETLINQGLDSGNRNARVKAASLAGLTGYEAGIPLLRVLFQDRAVQLSTPAARALARLPRHPRAHKKR